MGPARTAIEVPFCGWVKPGVGHDKVSCGTRRQGAADQRAWHDAEALVRKSLSSCDLTNDKRIIHVDRAFDPTRSDRGDVASKP